MSLCTEKKYKERVIAGVKKRPESVACTYGDRHRTLADRTKAKIHEIFHRHKILRIRKQIKEDKYDLNKKLDIAMDRMIEDLLQQK